MDKFLILFAASSAAAFPLLLYVQVKLDIEGFKLYKHVSKTHRRMELALLLLPLAGIAAALLTRNAFFVPAAVFLYLLALTALRMVMELRHDKASKRYILNLIALIYCSAVTAGAFIFLPMRLF